MKAHSLTGVLKTPPCWNPLQGFSNNFSPKEHSLRCVPKFSNNESHLLESVASFNQWISKWRLKKSPQGNWGSHMDADDSSWHSTEILKVNLWPTPGHRDWKGPSGMERTMKKMKAGKAPDNLPTASRIWGELKESSSDFPTTAYDCLNLLSRHLQLFTNLVCAEPIDPT